MYNHFQTHCKSKPKKLSCPTATANSSQKGCHHPHSPLPSRSELPRSLCERGAKREPTNEDGHQEDDQIKYVPELLPLPPRSALGPPPPSPFSFLCPVPRVSRSHLRLVALHQFAPPGPPLLDIGLGPFAHPRVPSVPRFTWVYGVWVCLGIFASKMVNGKRKGGGESKIDNRTSYGTSRGSAGRQCQVKSEGEEVTGQLGILLSRLGKGFWGGGKGFEVWHAMARTGNWD